MSRNITPLFIGFDDSDSVHFETVKMVCIILSHSLQHISDILEVVSLRKKDTIVRFYNACVLGVKKKLTSVLLNNAFRDRVIATAICSRNITAERSMFTKLPSSVYILTWSSHDSTLANLVMLTRQAVRLQQALSVV